MTEKRTRGRRRRRSEGPSEAVRDRILLANDLDSSLDRHEEEIVDRFDELLGSFLEDGEKLRVAPLLRALRRLIQDRLARLQEADEARAREVGQDRSLQRRQREAMAELRQRLVELRRAVDVIYGRNATREFLGLEGRTARDSERLLREGQRAVDRIGDPERSRPEPRPPHRELDWDAWRDRIREPLEQLATVSDKLYLDLKESQKATDFKSLDLERYDREVGATGRWLSATYELLGYEPARKNLLPESRKRRRKTRRPREAPDSENRENPEKSP